MNSAVWVVAPAKNLRTSKLRAILRHVPHPLYEVADYNIILVIAPWLSIVIVIESALACVVHQCWLLVTLQTNWLTEILVSWTPSNDGHNWCSQSKVGGIVWGSIIANGTIGSCLVVSSCICVIKVSEAALPWEVHVTQAGKSTDLLICILLHTS